MWRTGTKTKVFAKWTVQNRYSRLESTQKIFQNLIPGIEKANRKEAAIGLASKSHEQRQDGDKRETCKDRYTSCHKFTSSLLETVGWVGTAVVAGLNLHLHFCPRTEEYVPAKHGVENCISHQLCTKLPFFLPRFVSAMPSGSRKTVLPEEISVQPYIAENKPLSKETSTTDIKQTYNRSLEDELQRAAATYTAHIEHMQALYFTTRNPKKAVKHFQRAAALGFSKAHFNLGVCYEMGRGTSINYTKAAYHYKQAAVAGHGCASYNLGCFYLQGVGGLERNEEIGMEYIRRAAEKGIVEAHNALNQYQWTNQDFKLQLPEGEDLPVKSEEFSQKEIAEYPDLDKKGVKPVGLFVRSSSYGINDTGKTDDGNGENITKFEILMKSNTEKLQPSVNHLSSSSPELSQSGVWESFKLRSTPFVISQYLGLIFPTIYKRRVVQEPKCMQEDEIDNQCFERMPEVCVGT
ncbi:uncharacterized protein LOC143243868 isoform X2 [Tachypleus tridentatus]|uniref:uncharacterized protein LOC143243868 isoform X2 n=1 Tax=Tachypleus tridentatus TaxID=6853 RepID=UPI003FD00EF5